MCKDADQTRRDSAFRIFAGCPNLASSWISKRMPFSGSSRTVCRTDRALRCVHVILFTKIMIFFDFFVGPARGFAGFSILSHVLRSAPSRTVLIAHVPDARNPSLALPRQPPEVPHRPHTPHNLPPATIRPSFACPALFPPRPDHTVGRFRSNADGREALPMNAEFHIPADAEWGSRR